MKTIALGEVLPFGLTKMVCGGFRIKLPWAVWYGRHYDVRCDEYLTGWYVCVLVIRVNAGLQSIPTPDQRTEYI